MAQILLTAAHLRELDRRAIEEVGIPGVILMENAGRAVAATVLDELGDERAPVVILCGGGNNGGDGFVVARMLHQHGRAVTVLLVAERERVRGDALVNLRVLEKLPVPIVPCHPKVSSAAREALARAPVIVDALFGTGLRSAPEGAAAELIELANESPAGRVAVDLPSGVAADTGQVLGVAFRAHVTVTFAAAKIGLFGHPGGGYSGLVRVADIGIPRHLMDASEACARLADSAVVAPALRPREICAHKGSFGHCLVVAGSPGKGGAALLAGRGALSAGAGLVTIATDEPTSARIEGRAAELMVETLRGVGDRRVDKGRLEALLAGKQALAVGPGLRSDAWGESLVRALPRCAKVPVVLDADGLNALAPHPGALAEATAPFILTPHPGEMGRLLGVSSAAVQEDRFKAARSLASRERATVVLKGAYTVIAAPDGRLSVNPTGNPGMATAGMGDVLTGILAALLARGLSPFEAAQAGVFLHGAAGDQAAEVLEENSVTAGSLIDSLPAVMRRLSRECGEVRP